MQQLVEEEWSDDELNLHINEEEDYTTVFENLKSKWLLAEIDHCVSKTASEEFWKLGLKFFPILHGALGRKKKTPQFKTIRRRMHDELVPKIELEIAYKNRSSGEIKIIKDTKTPSKQYNSASYEKLYEIGTVKVMKKPIPYNQYELN